MVQSFHSMTMQGEQKKIIRIQPITDEVWAFYFEKGKKFSFLPGQYVELTLRGISPFPMREFTIASSPLDEKFFRIVTKKGESAFKCALFTLKEGASVSITYPKGGFVLNESDKRERIFISGGLGITPFYSMIAYANQKKLPIAMTLFASFKNEKDMLFNEDLEKIKKDNNLIRTIYSLTGVSSSTGNRENGRLTKELIKKNVSDINNKLFLIAGPNKMVDDMQDMLEDMQISNSNIRVEYFNGYESVE